MKDILKINAHIKYIEYLLDTFDNGSDNLTLKEIRKDFQNKFNTDHLLLNQFFGLYRLLPLILIKEEYKDQKKELVEDIKKIKIIRDAVAHHSFTFDEKGYEFQDNKNIVKFTYEEFTIFLHKIENEFYKVNL